MLTPDAARKAAAKAYGRSFAVWATASGVNRGDGWLVDRPLHPPAERTALADPAAVSAWIAAWRDADPDNGPDGHVVWSQRRWASMGTQVVPDRLSLRTPEVVARFAGRTRHWQRATGRAARLLEILDRAQHAGSTEPGHGRTGDVARDGDAVRRRAVAQVLGAVVGLDPADEDRLARVLEWVLTHEPAGLFVRQVPVRGIDTKWLERHRSIVDPLYSAATGREHLELASRPQLLRVRFLDRQLAPGGLRDVAAPVPDLARLTVRPHTVVVIENLESLLALPDLAGAVAVHGQGYAAHLLHHVGWIRRADVVYWGDLDTDGLNILSSLRSRLPHARSILMDRATLTTHHDLAVPEPRPRRSVPPRLTDSESDAFVALRELGDMRLEQERLPWATALDAVVAAVGHRDAWPGTTAGTGHHAG